MSVVHFACASTSMLKCCVCVAGERCPCGTWVTPALHIHMNKVDKCAPRSLPNVLGGAGGKPPTWHWCSVFVLLPVNIYFLNCIFIIFLILFLLLVYSFCVPVHQKKMWGAGFPQSNCTAMANIARTCTIQIGTWWNFWQDANLNKSAGWVYQCNTYI